MIPFIGPLISGIFGVGKQYLSNKAEKSKAKHDQEIAVINGDQTWDQIQAKNSGDSWKDEFLTPFIVMFTAAAFGDIDTVNNIALAFKVIQTKVPQDYWSLLLIAFGASFGVKGIIKGARTFMDGKKK